MNLSLHRYRPLLKKITPGLIILSMIFLLVALEDQEPLFSILAFSFLLITVIWTIAKIREVVRLKEEKLQTELLHLQSQVNPHFFFNTLNNLYGSIDKENTKAREMVLRLSDMMRYSIYDGQKEWVYLEQEVKYLRNYIELHKTRYHRESDIKFDCKIKAPDVKVLPLLFIILMENAFKHGVEKLKENAFVDAKLIADEDRICFQVENNMDPDTEQNEKGLGLQNLQKRLNLYYPRRHSLEYLSSGNTYTAKLTIKLP